MFVSKFLKTAAPCEAVQFNRRSILFAARAAMRCNPASEPPSISPMTAALVSVANQRTECPEVPSTSDLVTASVDSATEVQEVTPSPSMVTVTKSGKKREKQMPSDARRKRASRKKDGTGVAESGSARDSAQSENSG